MNLNILKRLIQSRYGGALALSILLQGALVSTLSPLLPILISEKIGLSKSEVIVFFVLNTLIGMAVILGTGWLSDGTIARYKLVLVGAFISTLGFIGLSQATLPVHAWLAGIAIAAMSVSFPQLFAVAKSSVVAEWEREAQVMGITVLRTMFSLGFIFGTAIASGVAHFDIRLVFLGIAAANVMVALAAAYLLRRMEADGQQEKRRVEAVSEAVPVPKGRDLPLWVLIVPVLATLSLLVADGTRGVYLPLAMFQLYKDASIAPLMFGLTAAGELVMMSMMGYLAGKIGEKTAISIGALVGAAYYAVMSFSQSLPVLYVANAVYAIFVGATAGVAMVYMQHLMGRRAGMGGSLYMTLFNMGGLISILLPLLVHDYDQTIFIAPIILCLAGAALLIFGDRTAQVEKRLRDRPAEIEARQEVLAAK
jgi:MFS transporter, SET family, sugar efflux transporter